MLADFFTKPLKGTLFKFFKDVIMGYVSIQQLTTGTNEIKEHVEKPKNENELICVDSAGNTKKEHGEQKKGPMLYTLGKDLRENTAEATAGVGNSRATKSNSGYSPTYAVVVKSFKN